MARNFAEVSERVRRAIAKAGRKEDDVRLIAVSKFWPASAAAIIAGEGQIDFGENYVQEAEGKIRELNPEFPDLRWHMIGHVQSRKASHVAGRYALVHTLDSRKLADGMEKKLAELKTEQPVLIEVNVGEEAQKSGVTAKDAEALAAYALENCPGLKLRGLMCIPPVFDNPEAARPYFAKLRETRDRMEKNLGVNLPELSMGMSGDFEAAIEEGATLVRVGTAIFGARPLKIP